MTDEIIPAGRVSLSFVKLMKQKPVVARDEFR